LLRRGVVVNRVGEKRDINSLSPITITNTKIKEVKGRLVVSVSEECSWKLAFNYVSPTPITDIPA
jgi:hypothetical protein